MDIELQRELFRQFQLGEPHASAAFTKFVSVMRKPLLSLCINITGNADDAKDAVQESFIAIHQQLPKFRAESTLSTWAFQIALRIALRTRAYSQRKESLDALAEVAHPQLSPEREVEGRQTGRDLERAMEQLSAEHRLVLSLFAVDGLSHKEIAQLLDVPEGTVWSRLHSARKSLHAFLKIAGE